MERLHQLLKELDPQGYYSSEDMKELCKDSKFEYIFEDLLSIIESDQIMTPEIREYFKGSNYSIDTALQIEEERQNYGNTYDILNWEKHLAYYTHQKSNHILRSNTKKPT